MNPIDVIVRLTNLDRSLATTLLAGLAVFAAAAIVLTWAIDLNTTVLIGLYIIAFAVLLYVVSNIFSDPTLKLVVGWFVVVVVIGTTSAFFVSAIFPGRTAIPPTWCLVRFWENCETATNQAATRNPVTEVPPIVQPPPPAPAINRANYDVYVQFAGLIARDDVRAMMQTLEQSGWDVQGTSGGGERTENASGYNEIRYGRVEDEIAARELAAAVQAVNVSGSPVRVRMASGIDGGALEVWISRV